MRFFVKRMMNGMQASRGLAVPHDVHSAPSEAGTKSGEHHFVAFFQFGLVFIDAQRNRSGACVAIFFDIDKHFSGVDAESRANCLDDAKISLMRDEPVDAVDREIVAFQHFERRLEHVGNSVLIHSPTFLIDEMLMSINSFVGSGEDRATGFHYEVRETGAIDMIYTVDNADILFGRLKKYSGCSVAK